VVDRLRSDPDLGVADVELGSRLNIRLIDARTFGFLAVVEWGLGLLDDDILHDVARLVDLLAVDALGRTVELRIGEQGGRAGVIEDVERELVRVGEQPRATADHLLEHRHRADGPKEHNVLDRRQVYACREHLRSRRDHRRVALGVREVAEVTDTDLSLHQPAAREVLGQLLDKYAEYGIGQLDDLGVLEVPPISALGSPAEIAGRFGSPAALREAVEELGELLYVA
jgi:hypothetical protein